MSMQVRLNTNEIWPRYWWLPFHWWNDASATMHYIPALRHTMSMHATMADCPTLPKWRRATKYRWRSACNCRRQQKNLTAVLNTSRLVGRLRVYVPIASRPLPGITRAPLPHWAIISAYLRARARTCNNAISLKKRSSTISCHDF